MIFKNCLKINQVSYTLIIQIAIFKKIINNKIVNYKNYLL